MFCYKCGKQVPEETEFCMFCGADLSLMKDYPIDSDYAQANNEEACFIIDEVLEISNVGTVLQGTMESGVFLVNQPVSIEEFSEEVYCLKGIENNRQLVQRARKGDRVGLLLSDLKYDEALKGKAIRKVEEKHDADDTSFYENLFGFVGEVSSVDSGDNMQTKQQSSYSNFENAVNDFNKNWDGNSQNDLSKSNVNLYSANQNNQFYNGNQQNGFNGNQQNGFNGNQQNGFNGNQQNGFNGNQQNGFNGNQQNGFNGNQQNGFNGNQQNGFNGNQQNGGAFVNSGGFNRLGGIFGNVHQNGQEASALVNLRTGNFMVNNMGRLTATPSGVYYSVYVVGQKHNHSYSLEEVADTSFTATHVALQPYFSYKVTLKSGVVYDYIYSPFQKNQMRAIDAIVRSKLS